MSKLEDEIVAHLRTFHTAPFLFVGSGVSRRYLGLETWDGLLERFAAKTTKPYARFKSQANGEYPMTATLIAREFHDIWWEDDAYEESRRLFSTVRRFDSPLKIEISRHIEAAVAALDYTGPYADELKSFRAVEVDGIITTNYDGLLEALFPTFRPFVGQNDVLFSETQEIGEIYKIHGSYKVPDSLVLTDEDYRDFEERNAYLAAKLLTIFVDHPVIFLGYSMQDRNINSILTSIARGLTRDHLQKLQDRLMFFEWDEDARDPTLGASHFNLTGSVIPVRHAKVPDYEAILTALGQVERKLPVRVLRVLKERVYELVATTDPVGALRVMPMDDDTDPSRVDVVAGVGVIDRIGYLGLARDQLIDDVLNDASNVWDDKVLVATALPGILREARLSPVFKYLAGAGLLDGDGRLDAGAVVAPEIRQRVERHEQWIRPTPKWYAERGDEFASTGGDFSDLVAAEEPWRVLMFLTRLPPERQDADALRQFLIEHRDMEQATNNTHRNHWIKAVCLYDWLKHGRG